MSRTARRPLPRHLLLLVPLVVAGLGACGGDDDEAASGADGTTTTAADEAAPAEELSDAGDGEVEIVDFTFAPEEITVAAGTTVTWANADQAVHSVADRELGFDSGDMAQGDTFEQTYDEPGEYPYVCGIHNYMRGTVTVE